MGTTLGDAIADTRGYVDDRLGRRWTRDQVVRGLASAVSTCISEYVSRGGDQFIEELAISTDATGNVSLRAVDPLRIRSIIVATTGDGFTYPLRPADPEIRGTDDLTVRDLIIRFARRPKAPTDDHDQLIGVVDGVMHSWTAFDRWVCMVAALELGITDRDARAELIQAEDRKRREILSSCRIPSALPWPRERRKWLWDLRWLWLPSTQTVQLRLAGVRGF